ncbi:hypothetical protein R5W23_002831 [Gemmata sp. JC673]|uniref:Uncharacterized protein n=1 Tax=Gemmata algarum TaxID=2975278 RepID=A0ABU5F5M6_9BACT|nr:hypothetical protein [Gemmata algarum]MDY3561553.1 hypothetical protein [Gemmata algarum]
MDPDALVSYQLDEGSRLLLRLTEAGIEVTVAAWVQRAEDGRWLLLIALPIIDRQGFAAGITEVLSVLREREQTGITSDDLVAFGTKDPRATELLRTREQVSGRLFGRFQSTSLAGLPVREVYVYPERLETKLSESQQQLLIDLYAHSPLTLDALPYTEEMERMHRQFVQQTGTAVPIGDLFKALGNLRKRSRLPRKSPPQVEIESGSPTESV